MRWRAEDVEHVELVIGRGQELAETVEHFEAARAAVGALARKRDGRAVRVADVDERAAFGDGDDEGLARRTLVEGVGLEGDGGHGGTMTRA